MNGLQQGSNLTSFLPRFSSGKIHVHKPKTWGVFLDFRGPFFEKNWGYFFSPPQGWSSSMAFESGLIHIHPTCPLSNWLGRWISSSIHGTCDHSLVDLPVNHQWLYHSFFSVTYFLKSTNSSVFLYFFTGGWFFLTPAGRNLNINQWIQEHHLNSKTNLQLLGSTS